MTNYIYSDFVINGFLDWYNNEFLTSLAPVIWDEEQKKNVNVQYSKITFEHVVSYFSQYKDVIDEFIEERGLANGYIESV